MVPFMGTNAKTYSLSEVLFSKTQRQVLGLLFGHPEKSFYSKEIFRFAGVGIGSVHRELEKLSTVGLLTVEKVGNQKHYQANEKSPIFEELKGLIQKTFGLADVLKETLSAHSDIIKLAFIYGSVAKGTDRASSDSVHRSRFEKKTRPFEANRRVGNTGNTGIAGVLVN